MTGLRAVSPRRFDLPYPEGKISLCLPNERQQDS
jgi:hypothetical protein